MTDDLTTAIHTYLTTAPSSGFAGQDVRVVETWRGSDNLLWRIDAGGEDAVVKLFLDAGQARGRRQFDGQHLFAPLGLAPKPLWFDRYPDGLARQVLVYRWAEGEALDATDEEALAQMAENAARIHNSDTGDVRRFCPRPVNLDYFWSVLAGGIEPAQRWGAAIECLVLAQTVHLLGEQAAALVTEALPLWQTASPTPVHGDLSLANSLHMDGHVVFVDWEMFGLGDPALEIARFLADSHMLLPPSVRSAWLLHYLEAMQDSDIQPRVRIYESLLPLDRLSFLLNGLHALTDRDRRDDAFRSRADFLADTILTATVAASAALDVELPFPESALRSDIERLIS